MSNSFFKIGKLTGKGAAALTCLCLAAVAAVGVYTYSRSDVTKEQEKLTAAEEPVLPDPDPEKAVNAGAVQNNIPILPAEDLVPEAAEDVIVEMTETEPAETEAETEVYAPQAENTPVFNSGTAIAEGATVRPLDGKVIEPFSNGELVKSKTLNVWKTHDGIDISGECGEPIRAAAQGTVTAIYTDPMWGNCIVIEHTGGYESCYYGVSDTIYVSENETVNAGSEIAEVGDTADGEAAEETHLHFGIKKNGSWIDPADALSDYGS